MVAKRASAAPRAAIGSGHNPVTGARAAADGALPADTATLGAAIGSGPNPVTGAREAAGRGGAPTALFGDGGELTPGAVLAEAESGRLAEMAGCGMSESELLELEQLGYGEW